MRRILLIISCSQTKKKNKGEMEAIDRYDGPVYKTLRLALKKRKFPIKLQVIILSAKYGFIDIHDLIENYDERMTSFRVTEMKYDFKDQFIELTRGCLYPKVLVNLGKDYMPALPWLKDVLDGEPELKFAHGQIGIRLKTVKAWLIKNSEPKKEKLNLW